MDSISFSSTWPERTSIYMTLLQTCLKLWENGTQSRIITTSSSRDSLSLMQTTSKPYWTLQSITLTLDNKLLLMLSPMPIRILPRLSSCSSSMDQVELGRPLFTMPSLPRPDYRAILSFVLQAQALHPNSFSMDQLPTPCSRSPSHVMKSPPVVSRSRVLWLHYSVQQG